MSSWDLINEKVQAATATQSRALVMPISVDFAIAI